MTSKMIALSVLDGLFVSAVIAVLLVIIGFPMDWLLATANMSTREFQQFGLFVVFATLCLIHAIGTSDSAP
jgi:ABC-type spermidine/putrescine transport system permease subunit I